MSEELNPAVEADAERYRFLRNLETYLPQEIRCALYEGGAELDEAIDRAIATVGTLPGGKPQAISGGHLILVVDVNDGEARVYLDGVRALVAPLPKPRWIPVSERLPEMDLPPGDCRKSHTRHLLVLYASSPGGPEQSRASIGHRSIDDFGGSFWWSQLADVAYEHGWELGEVVAWMEIPPLPEEP